MVRTQIELSEEQARGLKELAVKPGISMAELIRQAVGHLIEGDGRDEKRRRARGVIGKFHGPRDLSTNHDHYLTA